MMGDVAKSDITERLDAWARHATDEETGHMELTDREWDELAGRYNGSGQRD
jgi:hypothetical protein